MNNDQSETVNLADKLQRFTETWNPHVVGELNGQQLKSDPLDGECAHGFPRPGRLDEVLHPGP